MVNHIAEFSVITLFDAYEVSDIDPYYFITTISLSMFIGITYIFKFICFNLFMALRCFQHCTGHITTGSWKGRGNQYIQLVKALYCKLPTNGKQLPAFPLEAVPGTEPQPQRWEARVLPLCHRGPLYVSTTSL